ncbi:hypothetical protein ACH492_36795 [Streptomyces sp. NPDC019443]
MFTAYAIVTGITIAANAGIAVADLSVAAGGLGLVEAAVLAEPAGGDAE